MYGCMQSDGELTKPQGQYMRWKERLGVRMGTQQVSRTCCTHLQTHTHTRACMCVYCVSVYVHAHTHAQARARTHTHTSARSIQHSRLAVHHDLSACHRLLNILHLSRRSFTGISFCKFQKYMCARVGEQVMGSWAADASVTQLEGGGSGRCPCAGGNLRWQPHTAHTLLGALHSAHTQPRGLACSLHGCGVWLSV